MPRNLLFVGDLACTTGFGRVNEELLTRIDRTVFTPHVLGINASGDPHPLRERLHIYPAREDGHPYGVNRFASLVDAVKPALVVIHQDAWIVPAYLEAAESVGVKLPPVIAYCPPDSPNQPAGVKLRVQKLLCPTQFGVDELRKGGYSGSAAVLPYGVDTTKFFPEDQTEARKLLGFPERFTHGFVVGRADRNAQRKRYDLTIGGWRLWWDAAGRPDTAALQLNCVPHEAIGWDLPQLTLYYGIKTQVLFSVDRETRADRLPPSEVLRHVYNTWDAHLSTVHGEGHGLVAHESAACRVPQILPRYAAYGEIWKDAALFMEPAAHHVHTAGINTVGGVVRVEDVAEAIMQFYSYESLRLSLSGKAFNRATESRYDWARIAQQFQQHCEEVTA